MLNKKIEMSLNYLSQEFTNWDCETHWQYIHRCEHASKQAGRHAQYLYIYIYIYILCYQNSNDAFAKPITYIKKSEAQCWVWHNEAQQQIVWPL